MPLDVVFPHGNEKQFVDLGRKLGVTRLIFAYRSVDDAAQLPDDWKKALFIDTASSDAAKKQIMIAEKKGFLSLVVAHSAAFNRFILEKTAATALVDAEFVNKTDHLHFRRSGLDQVLCRLAARNKKAFFFSFSHLLESKDWSVLLGRVMQNISFCQKYRVPYGMVSFAHDPLEMKGMRDLKSLMRVLGMKIKLNTLLDDFFRNV